MIKMVVCERDYIKNRQNNQETTDKETKHGCDIPEQSLDGRGEAIIIMNGTTGYSKTSAKPTQRTFRS
jgi:hypothetical protein